MGDINNKHILRTAKGPIIRSNREYLFNAKQNLELNTYVSWDEVVPTYDMKSELSRDNRSSVKSIFNKYTTVFKSEDLRLGNNVPLIDTPEIRRKIKEKSNCSIKNLIKCSQDGTLGSETYDYSDFAYCKYLGKMPNNYMITLRRFPIPINDYINSPWNPDNFGDPSNAAAYVPPLGLGCMVTWIGTPGNEMENILTYDYKMPFQAKKAELQTPNNSADSNKSYLNSFFAAFDPTYQKQVQLGQAGSAVFDLFGPLKKYMGDAPYSDHLTQRDANKVYGPVDVIKETYMRSDEGLQFNQSISLTFEYELRSYSNINTRQAMLDLLANILAVTYTSGDFWGGGYQSFGAHQSDLYTNMKVFKTAGTVGETWDALTNDVSSILSHTKNYFSKKKFTEILSDLGNGIGGMIIGGLLNKLGRPEKAFLNSVLSPAPVGLWHVTIGNPFHPIMSIGNMILTKTTITHTGPLGLDDFPTGLKVVCTLERGKGRDKRDIEKLYMHGINRIYSHMGNEIEELYKKSPDYKENKSKTKTNAKNNYEDLSGLILDLKNTANDIADEISDSRIVKRIKKYFGTGYMKSIILSSGEISYGSQRKKKVEQSK